MCLLNMHNVPHQFKGHGLYPVHIIDTMHNHAVGGTPLTIEFTKSWAPSQGTHHLLLEIYIAIYM